MKLGCVTYNVLQDLTVDEIITKLAAAKFEAVELRAGHKHNISPALNTDDRQKLKSKFAASPVRLLSYGTACEYHSADPALRRKNIEETKQWIDLARDTGALGVKVRPNGFPPELSRDQTIQNIGVSLKECGDYAQVRGIEIWLEVHGRDTQVPPVCAAIMKATNQPVVGLCWNSNPTDVVNGSVKPSWEMLKPWVKSAHITNLSNESYPWRELFTLMNQSGYDRYTLCETDASCEAERFLRYYRALWKELSRP